MPAPSLNRPSLVVTVSLLVGLAAGPASGIEMFTFFGDGSRIGLPSLEVPVEAYPGIPLRSDRIRMRTGRFGRWRPTRQPVARPIAQPNAEPNAKQNLEPREQAPPTAGGIRIRPMTAESKEWPVAPSPSEE